MTALIFLQRTTESVAQRGCELRVVVLLLDQFIHAKRLADDLVLGKVAAAFHFFADKLLLVRCEQNFHAGKLKSKRAGVKNFTSKA